jgi:RNA polymerase sigma-70 factor (ECF subfamily)
MPEQVAQRMHSAVRQDDESFGRQLVAMQSRVRAFLRTLGSGGADDLMQETMARAWRSRATFAVHRGSFDAWLLRIAFRTFLDERRRAQRTPGQVAALPEGADGGAPADLQPQPSDQAAAREQMAAWLSVLEPTECTVLLRFHRDGRSVAEIAQELALPAGTVKSHLHRARARLWQRCQEEAR